MTSAEIVRRDVGRHADRDPLGAVDQQVRKARRQYLRLVLGVVVVGLKVDGVVVEVVEQRIGDTREARLGVAVGRRRVAVHRAEIALAVDQRQAHREILRHAHHRVVDRQLAVRVVFADHVADDARRFAVAAVPLVAVDLHRIKDAAVNRLQAVADIGQRAGHDHAHRVIEVRALHLVLDRDRGDVGGGRRCGGQGQGGSVGWRCRTAKPRPGPDGAAAPPSYRNWSERLPHFAAAKEAAGSRRRTRQAGPPRIAR